MATSDSAADADQYPTAESVADFERNISAVQARIAAAATRAGRDAAEVRLLPVSEDSKFGLPPDELAGFLAQLPQYTALKVRGLMTLAVFTSDTSRVRGCFTLLRELRDRARAETPELIGPGELSMGMSGDYETAIEEGATVVRVGQAIFGARAVPDSHYRPSG